MGFLRFCVLRFLIVYAILFWSFVETTGFVTYFYFCALLVYFLERVLLSCLEKIETGSLFFEFIRLIFVDFDVGADVFGSVCCVLACFISII